MAALRNDKAVIFREAGVFLVTTRFFESNLSFFIINVGETLEEKNRRYITLIFVLIDGATQNIAGFKQVRKQLLTGCFFRMCGTGFQFHISYIHSGLHHLSTTSCLYFFTGGRFYTYATTFLNFLKFSRILIFKFQENFQETLVQKCKSVFSDISRHTIIRLGNSTGDSRQGVTVTSNRNGVANSILKTGRLKECFECLRDGILTGFVKLVGITNGIQGEVNRIVVLHDIILNFHQTASSTSQIDCNGSSFRPLNSFWVIVGCLGNCS